MMRNAVVGKFRGLQPGVRLTTASFTSPRSRSASLGTRCDMGKSQRDKGARGEREVVNILKAAGFDTAQRTGEWKANDILCAVDGHDRVIEVKMRAKGFSGLYEFLKGSWAVVHKADYSPWLITMTLDDWLKLKA
jgi:hypothetical protein